MIKKGSKLYFQMKINEAREAGHGNLSKFRANTEQSPGISPTIGRRATMLGLWLTYNKKLIEAVDIR